MNIFEHSKKFKILVAINAVFIASIALFAFFYIKSEKVRAVELPTPTQILPASNSGLPVSISIPSIGVDANIQDVGITKGGNMAVPDNYTETGWFRHGAVPGEAGNAVIAGHLDNAAGKPAVFFDLKNIKISDEVVVEDSEGRKSKFVVRAIRSVDYLNPPREVLDEVFGASTASHLNLITCDGTWQQAERSYTDRLIVFTDFTGFVE